MNPIDYVKELEGHLKVGLHKESIAGLVVKAKCDTEDAIRKEYVTKSDLETRLVSFSSTISEIVENKIWVRFGKIAKAAGIWGGLVTAIGTVIGLIIKYS